MDRNRIEASNIATLSKLLPIYLTEVGWSERQLAQRANIPRGTIRNWCKGAVAKPRDWRGLIQVAVAMRLETHQTDALLQSAGHPPLSELWLKIKSEDDKLLLAKLLPSRSVQKSAPTFQAMPDLPYFVGREAELSTLKNFLLADYHPTIYILYGMAGVGKTSLATHLAYEVRDFFTDGVLWARADTIDIMSLLKLLADAFNQDVSQYADLFSRSQAVRGILADKKALLVLDNVENSQQIQPLLPPNGPCAVLITTRKTNLSIARGCPQVQLKPFEKKTQYSQELFVKIIGQDAAKTEQKPLNEIANLLGHLPLALSIVAGRIAQEPHTTANSYLAQLKREKAGLDTLTLEEQSVRVSINSSFSALSKREQWFFSSLGVFGGEDFSLDVAAAVTNISLEQTRIYLSQLYSLSLVQAGKNQRFRLHPVLREYAKTQISDNQIYKQMIEFFAKYVEDNRENFKAIEQEFDNIISALNEAFEQKMNSVAIEFTINLSQFLDVSGLRDIALHNLERAEQIAVVEADKRHLVLIKCARGNAEKNVHWQTAQSYLEEGLRIAESSCGDEVIAIALKDLGLFHHSRGEFDIANNYWQKSLVLARKTKQENLLGFLFHYLAAIAINYTNDYNQAEKLFLEGLDLQRRQKNLPATSIQLMNLSMIAFSLGNYKQSEQYIRDSEHIAKEIGYPLVHIILSRHKASLLIAQKGDYFEAEKYLLYGENLARELENAAATGFILTGLGIVYARLNKFNPAVTYLQEALLLSNETRRPDLEIEVLTTLGFIAGQNNRHRLAESHFSKAISLAKSYNDKWYLCRTLEEWGEFNISRQKIVFAQTAFEDLLELSKQSKFQELIAMAQFGLARIAFMDEDLALASQLGVESLENFSDIGHFYKNVVNSWLAENDMNSADVDHAE